jgi:nitrate/nitrite transport system ATP-binding protein
MHKHPNYYPLRNHMIDFLVTRSKDMAKGGGMQFDPRQPPVVRPSHTLTAVTGGESTATGPTVSHSAA